MTLMTIENLIKNGYYVVNFDSKASKDPVVRRAKKPLAWDRRHVTEEDDYCYYKIWINLRKGEETISFAEDYRDQKEFANELKELWRILIDEAETAK